MKNYNLWILRFIPVAVLSFMMFQFILMQKIAEPYPAVILPPFSESSTWDSLVSYNFKAIAVGSGNKKDIDLRKVFEGVPSIAGFFLIANLKEGANTKHQEKNIETGSPIDELKKILITKRQKSLNKSNKAFAGVKNNLKIKSNNLAGFKVDSIILYRMKKTKRWVTGKVIMENQYIKSISFVEK